MSKKLRELNMKSLKYDEKMYKVFLYVMIGLVGFMVVIGVFSYFKKESFHFTQISPLFFILMVFVIYIQLKNVRKEINSRK